MLTLQFLLAAATIFCAIAFYSALVPLAISVWAISNAPCDALSSRQLSHCQDYHLTELLSSLACSYSSYINGIEFEGVIVLLCDCKFVAVFSVVVL